ncbi:hypothetical protein T310_9907, partial [Rasamsonia emersonii CBS 393.64]
QTSTNQRHGGIANHLTFSGGTTVDCDFLAATQLSLWKGNKCFRLEDILGAVQTWCNSLRFVTSSPGDIPEDKIIRVHVCKFRAKYRIQNHKS